MNSSVTKTFPTLQAQNTSGTWNKTGIFDEANIPPPAALSRGTTTGVAAMCSLILLGALLGTIIKVRQKRKLWKASDQGQQRDVEQGLAQDTSYEPIRTTSESTLVNSSERNSVTGTGRKR